MFSTSVEVVLHIAFREAVSRRHAYLTLEHLLYVLAHVRDRSKLGRLVGRQADVVLLHKAGWVDAARHDAGLIAWRGGILVASVMTHRPGKAGARADVLAGRVAQAALRRFRG